MSPERTRQERLEPTPARRRAKGKTRWGSFDRKAAQIRSLFSKNPALATLTATGLGIATLGKTATAKADWSFVAGNQTLDRVYLNTGALLSPPLTIGSSQASVNDAKWIQPSSGGPYIILSITDPGTYDKLVKMTDLDTATPTLDILPEPVSVPKQIDVNAAEGIFSVHSGGTGESLACQIDDTDVCERYLTGVTNSVGAIFDNLGSSNPTLIGVSDIDGRVNTYALAPDADGDGFPEPSATGEIATDSEDLGGAAAGLNTFHFDHTTKVLTVGAYTGEMLHSMDINTSSSTPSVLTRYDTPFTNLHPTGIIDTGTGELVVLGTGATISTGSRASFTTGLNAGALTPAVPEGNFTGFGSRVPQRSPGGMTSAGELAVIHANWQEVRLYDLAFNQVGGPFSVNAASIDAMVVAQSVLPADPLDIDDDGDGLTENQGDCNDGDATVSVESEFLQDTDFDNFGLTGSEQYLCGPDTVNGWTATVGGDCDDGDALIHPGATEVCDDVDNDCANGPDDGLSPSDWYDDSGDGDGYGDDATSTPDCNEPTLPGLWITQGGDCAPTDSFINLPIAQFPDADNDSFGAAGSQTTNICPSTTGWAPIDSDPDDNNPDIYPNALELPDGFDNGGNGYIDECLFDPMGTWPTNGLGNPVCVGIEFSDGDTVSATSSATGALEFTATGDRVLSLLGDEVWFLVDKTSPSSLPLAIDLGEGMSLGVAGTQAEGNKYADGEAWVTSLDLGDPAPHPVDATLGTPGNEETIVGAIQEGEVLVANWQTGEVNWDETVSEAVFDFYNSGDDDDSGDDDSADDDDIGDDDVGDDDTEDDDDIGDDDGTPDDDDATPDDDDSQQDDDDSGEETPDDDDSAVEIPDCEGCQATVLTIGPDGELKLNSRALAIAVFGTVVGLRRRKREKDLRRAA